MGIELRMPVQYVKTSRSTIHVTLKRRSTDHQKVSIYAGILLLNGAQYIIVPSYASSTCIGDSLTDQVDILYCVYC